MKKLRNITSQLVVAAIVLALLSTKAYGWFNTMAKDSVTYEVQEVAEATEYFEEYDYSENFADISETFDVTLYNGDDDEYKNYFFINEQAEYMEIVVDVWEGAAKIKLCDDEGNELKEWEGVANGYNNFIYDFNKNGIDTKRENFFLEIENDDGDNNDEYNTFSGNISYYVYNGYEGDIVEDSEIPRG